jgi:uncharacterized protein YggE
MNKKLTLLLSAFCFLLLPCFSFAQNVETTPHIEVTGNAQMSVVPDVFNVQIVLKEYLDGKFKVTVSEQETKMKNMLKIAGVDLSKLYLKNTDTDYAVVVNRENNTATEKIYTLTLSTLSMLSNAFQVLNDLNINDTKVILATHSQIDSLRQVVRAKAVQDAKEKANFLLKAFGNKLGKPLIIREYDSYPYMGEPLSSADPKTNEDIIENEYILAFKKIRIQSTIYVRFAIE